MNHDFLKYLESKNLPYEQKLFQLIQSQNFDKVLKFIRFTRNKHVELCQNGFLSFLLQIEDQDPKIDSLIGILILKLQTENLQFMEFINKESFIAAFSLRSEDILSILLKNINDNFIQFTIPTNENSIFQIIAKKDDPFLLESLLLQYYESLCNNIERRDAGLYLFQYSVYNDLHNIIDNFFLFIDLFQLNNDDLFNCTSLYNQFRDIEIDDNHRNSFINICNDIIFTSEALEYLNFTLFSPNYKNIHKDLNEDSEWLIETQNMTVCDVIEDTFSLQPPPETDPITTSVLIDADDILCELPYLLMSNPDIMINSNIEMSQPVINLGNATGSGVFKELFIKYLEQFFDYNIDDGNYKGEDSPFEKLFVSEGTQGIYIMPPMTVHASKIKEYKTIYYGLGVVFLKVLYSRIPVKCKLPFHIWVFKALLEDNFGDLILKDVDLFMEEAIQYHPENKWLDEQLSQSFIRQSNDQQNTDQTMSAESIPSFFFDSLFNDQRKDLLKCFKNGFFFEYDPDILPYCLKEPIRKTKHLLQSFYQNIKTLKPETLRYFLTQNQSFEFSRISRIFQVRWYKIRKLDVMDPHEDVEIAKSTRNKQIRGQMKRSQNIILNCFKEWCETNPEMMSHFLKITIGISSLTPLFTNPWTICITEKQPNFIFSWTCDYSINVPILKSKEHFIQLVNNNYGSIKDAPLDDYYSSL